MSATEETLLQCFLEQGGDHAVILLDESGRIVGWRAGSERILGYSREEAVGRHVSALFTPEDIAAGVSRHELALARACGRAEDDRWLMRKDGGRFWASGTAIALTDAGQRVIGFAKVLRDRTEIRGQIVALENQLRKANELNERKDQFIGRLAHEIRNPLSTIKMGLQALALTGAEATGQFTSMVDRQVKFMLRLVNDLLEGSRAAAGRISIERQVTALQGILVQAAATVSAHAEQRRQTFKVVMLPVALMVDVDADRIRQAVINLLENAIKYTPPEGRIWLKCTVEEQEAVVGVEDDGTGIDKDSLPWIFDLFTGKGAEFAPASGALGAGLGMGLPLVKELVSLHGGSIQVHSEGRGKGAEFTIRLPLAVPAGSPDAPVPGKEQ